MYLLASASSHAAWAAASTSCTSPSPPPRQNARSAAPSSEFNIRQVTPSYQSRSSCGIPTRGQARGARRWKGKPSGRSQRGSYGTSPGVSGERNIVLRVFDEMRVDLKMWRGSRECARPEYVPQWFGVKGCRGRWWFSPSQGQAFSPLQLTGRYICENLWRDNFRWQGFLEKQ